MRLSKASINQPKFQLVWIICIWSTGHVIWKGNFRKGKFLGTLGVRRNGVLFFHIHGGPYHEFNERIISWIWEERAQFSILREYLRITLFEKSFFLLGESRNFVMKWSFSVIKILEFLWYFWIHVPVWIQSFSLNLALRFFFFFFLSFHAFCFRLVDNYHCSSTVYVL